MPSPMELQNVEGGDTTGDAIYPTAGNKVIHNHFLKRSPGSFSFCTEIIHHPLLIISGCFLNDHGFERQLYVR